MSTADEKAALSEEEYRVLTKILNRTPNKVECHLAGAMWSEHCSYKSTKHLLARLPQKGNAVVGENGENAGIVDIGEGYGLAFKIESHNHPSAVAPYDGAATGLGGVVRDILAMGARPAACMAGLCFGNADDPHTQNLFKEVFKGIKEYGDVTQIPAIGGKTIFDPSYAENPLVNAFCVGIVKLGETISSKTALNGDLALIFGRKTNRDGVGSAEFASKELEAEAQSLPSIPKGDPYIEKRLIAACLELKDKKLITSMQDMGAAGIVSSTSEVAYKSALGIEIDCDKIPQDENEKTPMSPWELFLSETQERMFLTIKPEDLQNVQKIAERYQLECSVFGKMTHDNRYRALQNGQTVADVPVSLLGGAYPEELLPHWKSKAPDKKRSGYTGCKSCEKALPTEGTLKDTFMKIVGHNTCTDSSSGWKTFISETEQPDTTSALGDSVGLLSIEGTPRIGVFALDVDPWKCWIDPQTGAAESAALTLRALACAGALPLGMTDGLNYPSPQKPEQFWELESSIDGISAASLAYDCPVVSGNVSLYNEGESTRILPTPFIVSCGVLENKNQYLPSGQWKEGSLLFLAGGFQASLAGSRYEIVFGPQSQNCLPFAPAREKSFFKSALDVARQKLAKSVRVIAGGGLALALAKEAIKSGLGATLDLSPYLKDSNSASELLFGEGGARAIYCVEIEQANAFKKAWGAFDLQQIGTVGGTVLDCGLLKIDLNELKNGWRKI